MKKNNRKILFIDPFAGLSGILETPGISYLRGFLESKGIKTELINYNRIIKRTTSENYFKNLLEILPPEKRSYANQGRLNFNNIWRCLYCESPVSIIRKSKKIEIFEEVFSRSLKNLSGFSFVGISVTFHSQLFFSLILINYIRKHNPGVKIILGGQNLAMALSDYLELFGLNPMVDFLILGEGETPLYELMEQTRNYEEIPNLIYYNKKYIQSNNRCHFEDINNLPPPLFDYSPEDGAFMQTSRKCYWNKCSFCADSRFNYSPSSNVCSVKRAVNNLKSIVSNSGRRRVHFTDSCLPPHIFKEVPKEIIRSDKLSSVKYSSFLRAEDCYDLNTFKTAGRAGFVYLSIGAESLVPRLSRLINKNIAIDNYYRVADYCYKSNIRLKLNFIVNLPTQTEKELKQDIKAIVKLVKKYKNMFISVSFFSLMNESHIYNNPEKYKIRVIEKFPMRFFQDYLFERTDSYSLDSYYFKDIIFQSFDKGLSSEEKTRVNFSFSR